MNELGVGSLTAQLLAAGLVRAADELAPGHRFIKLDLGRGRAAILVITIPPPPPKADE